MSWPSWRPATVTIGISALRSVCLPTTAPLAHALGARGAHVVLAQHVEHGRARGPHQHRGLEESERDGRQEQRAQRRARARPTSRRSRRSAPSPGCTEKKRMRSRPAQNWVPRCRTARRSSPGSRRRAGGGWPRRGRAGIAVSAMKTAASRASGRVTGSRVTISWPDRQVVLDRAAEVAAQRARAASRRTARGAAGSAPAPRAAARWPRGLPSVPMISSAGSPGSTRTTTNTSAETNSRVAASAATLRAT